MSFGIPRCYAERCLAEREAARLAEREAADGCRPAGRTATLWDMVTTLVFLVRHAKAANRDVWTGGDRGRPLVERGRVQADRLAFDAPDLAGWVRATAGEHPGEAVVGVSHGDLIPLYLLRARIVSGAT